MAIWWGGLTFYAVFVVPTGVEVLGGETEQGFVTQRVSNSINLLATLTLAVLVWNAAVRWREIGTSDASRFDHILARNGWHTTDALPHPSAA